MASRHRIQESVEHRRSLFDKPQFALLLTPANFRNPLGLDCSAQHFANTTVGRFLGFPKKMFTE